MRVLSTVESHAVAAGYLEAVIWTTVIGGALLWYMASVRAPKQVGTYPFVVTPEIPPEITSLSTQEINKIVEQIDPSVDYTQTTLLLG